MKMPGFRRIDAKRCANCRHYESGDYHVSGECHHKFNVEWTPGSSVRPHPDDVCDCWECPEDFVKITVS